MLGQGLVFSFSIGFGWTVSPIKSYHDRDGSAARI
jgi:hypothetical protein